MKRPEGEECQVFILALTPECAGMWCCHLAVDPLADTTVVVTPSTQWAVQGRRVFDGDWIVDLASDSDRLDEARETLERSVILCGSSPARVRGWGS